MDVRELKSKFLLSRDYSTEDVNALMDFAKKAYIHDEITIKEYRQLVLELESQGAKAPFEQDSLIENTK
ncbi:YppF family protein [Neobacillus sp. Marseille-QA0830]